MTIQEYRRLQSELDALERLLDQLPNSSVIERQGLEFRKKRVQETLDSHRAELWTPARIRLTFRGRPVAGARGIFADFGAAVVNAFTYAVAAVGASRMAPLKSRGAIPGREHYRFLIAGTALGSFGFELEEAYCETDLLRESSLVESALKQTMSILEATDGTDEMLTAAISDADPRAIDALRKFLKRIADDDATCTLEFKGDTCHFSDVSQIRRSEERLSMNNIDQDERELSGRLLGVLPVRRRFEFLDNATKATIAGTIDPGVENVDSMNNALDRPATITIRSRRVGTAPKRYVLLAYRDTSDG